MPVPADPATPHTMMLHDSGFFSPAGFVDGTAVLAMADSTLSGTTHQAFGTGDTVSGDVTIDDLVVSCELITVPPTECLRYKSLCWPGTFGYTGSQLDLWSAGSPSSDEVTLILSGTASGHFDGTFVVPIVPTSNLYQLTGLSIVHGGNTYTTLGYYVQSTVGFQCEIRVYFLTAGGTRFNIIGTAGTGYILATTDCTNSLTNANGTVVVDV
jgi:hypothetical protein